MTLLEFFQTYWQDGLIYLVIGSGIVQFSPIKINPWSKVAQIIGRSINGELYDKITDLDNRLTGYIQQDQEDKVIEKRLRILMFADDIKRGENQSKEHFDQILRDIKAYNLYCSSHPDFKNNQTEHAAKLIETIYDDHLLKNDFL